MVDRDAAGREDEERVKAAVLTVSDGVVAGTARTERRRTRRVARGDGPRGERRRRPRRARTRSPRRSPRWRGGRKSCSRPAAPGSRRATSRPRRRARCSSAGPRASPRRSAPTRSRRRRTACSPAASPAPRRGRGRQPAGPPGGCRDGCAVSGPHSRTPCGAASRATRRRTPDVTTASSMPRRFASLVKFEHTVFALPFAYVGAFLAVDGCRARKNRLDDAGDGRRPLACDGAQPSDRRRHRRARTLARPARELPQGTLLVAGRRFCAGSLAVFLARRLPARPGRALALADPGGDVRRLPVPEAGHLALPPLARRLAASRRWAPGSPSRASFRWQAWALGGAVASGWPASTSSTRCSTSRSTASRDSTRGPRASASAASSRARACCTW